MKMKKMFILSILPLLLAVGSCSFISNDMVDSNEDLAARLMIPKNATIISAELVVNVDYLEGSSAVVNLHRVTSPWTEEGVTWGNLAGAYDSSVIDSITITETKEYSFNIKPYLEKWVAGEFTDYGLLLDQVETDGYVRFGSRENYSFHPYIQVVFRVNGEDLPEDDLLTADAYIWVNDFDYNGHVANRDYLYTGIIAGKEKQSLLKFQLEEEGEIVGTGTPGYWKNHPEAWPVDTIYIGGKNYVKEEAINMMMMPIKRYKWFTMFNSLVAAKLNVLLGVDDTVISDTILAADIWLTETRYPGSKADLDPWQIYGEDINTMLDDYNNGLLGVPARD